MKRVHVLMLLVVLIMESYPFEVYNLSYSRNDPTLPLVGSINWERISDSTSNIFSPRHSHATCTFKCPHTNRTCIWLTGGRTDVHRTFDHYYEDRAADIWWSETGATWNKALHVTGDFTFGIGNHDAKVGGEVAPWFARFGHSLDSMDVDNDGNNDVMLLMGGFNPVASNDVWISINGTDWCFVHYADWSERAYHATAIFQQKIWIMGGSPLTNDVWSGDIVREIDKPTRFKIQWKQQIPHRHAPWAPRAGMCAVIQQRMERVHDTGLLEPHEYMYLIGGYAAWPRDEPMWDDGRTRNDVWITSDGIDWRRLDPHNGSASMPFIGRGWHSCITWHDQRDKFRTVSLSTDFSRNDHLTDEQLKKTWPRIYIAGGGYMGTKENNVVTTLEGYLDLWYSNDGSEWIQVNYQEGHKKSLYSTNEWTHTLIKDTFYYLGKWGHSIESLTLDVDMNSDGFIASSPVQVELCNQLSPIESSCKTMNVTEQNHPTLILIGGDTTDGGPIVNDVFLSKSGIFCEVNGISCSRNGFCGPGAIGCVCKNSSYYGEYCENMHTVSSTASMKPLPVIICAVIIITIMLIT